MALRTRVIVKNGGRLIPKTLCVINHKQPIVDILVSCSLVINS